MQIRFSLDRATWIVGGFRVQARSLSSHFGLPSWACYLIYILLPLGLGWSSLPAQGRWPFAAFYLFFPFVLSAFAHWRLYSSIRTQLTDVNWDISEKGIQVSSGDEVTQVDWPKFFQMDETAMGLILYYKMPVSVPGESGAPPKTQMATCTLLLPRKAATQDVIAHLKRYFAAPVKAA